MAQVAACARDNELAVLYVNQVGGQDELVFDGGSFAVGADGEICVQAESFEESCVELGRCSPSGAFGAGSCGRGQNRSCGGMGCAGARAS